MYCYALTHTDGSFYKSISGAVYVDFRNSKKQAELYFKLQLWYDRFIGICRDKSDYIVKQISLDALDWVEELKKVKKEVEANSTEKLKSCIIDELNTILCKLEKITIRYKITIDMILQEIKTRWKNKDIKN